MNGTQDFRQIRLPEPGEIIDGRYRLGESFARGGMGVIMRAEQLQAGRDVAIKFLHPHVAAKDNIAARFKREVEVTTLFDHPSIVRVYDVGESDKGLLYLVMELLEGEELKEISRREGPMAQGRAVEIMMQMLDGLAEAHSRGIIHRDIKLSNIFIVPNRRGEDNVKLLDFGIAKLISGGKALTSTGTFTGTPSYVAPEALLNTGVSEKSIDVYAAGLVLLEMLTGRKVFDGGGIPQTIMLHLKNPVRIPRRIQDSALGEIICRATMKHPAERYVDADAMYMAIKAIYGELSRDLCLEADEIPPPYRKTPNFLMEIASAIPPSSVDALRELPQHEVYGGGSHQQDQGEPGWQDSVGHTEVDREIRPGNRCFLMMIRYLDPQILVPSLEVPLDR